MIYLLLAFLLGAALTAVVCLLIAKYEFQSLVSEATTLNGVDLFAEHHGMHRNAGESDDELIARVNRESKDDNR